MKKTNNEIFLTQKLPKASSKNDKINQLTNMCLKLHYTHAYMYLFVYVYYMKSVPELRLI